jgi:hypothetical protein
MSHQHSQYLLYCLLFCLCSVELYYTPYLYVLAAQLPTPEMSTRKKTADAAFPDAPTVNFSNFERHLELKSLSQIQLASHSDQSNLASTHVRYS